ncbi:unnamed protein product [Meloidogyne enterolobii]|uniref:Uncharacterized protein n=2 Tax=Meloidogyne enterolobii TaxID=390850 RepID=A0ACB0XXJ1_MELEN|nr:unnamed protein product [Meloidogyne enterolobii]
MAGGSAEKSDKGEDSADYEAYMPNIPKRAHPFNLRNETTIALKLWKADRESSLYIRERSKTFMDRLKQKMLGSEEAQRKRKQKKSRSRSRKRSNTDKKKNKSSSGA